MSKFLVVLSGGQDSTTCLFDAVNTMGAKSVRAIAFNYGQRHDIELRSAAIIAEMAGVPLEVIDVQGILQSTSPLTSDTPPDQYESFSQMEEVVGNKVEKTFVPMRNSLFLTIAANRAVALGCTTVVTGVCGQDNANYPDCTEEFINKIETSINQSLGFIRYEGSKRVLDERYITISTPLMFMSKAQSVAFASRIPGCMKALAYSHTSYDGEYPPTKNNHSNLLRAQGFLESGLPDPLVLRGWLDGMMLLPATSNYMNAWHHCVRYGLVHVASMYDHDYAYELTADWGKCFKKGDIVWKYLRDDFGMGVSKLELTSEPHVSVTRNPDGSNCFYTPPASVLSKITITDALGKMRI
ncbi:QueC-like queuosine biosynthesis [Pseudomonas phage Knedl]|nr:QueC-like queuosine biosynthesis [Pseudomonas phage Knedl]